ncbi:L,D-transpeptidase [Palleronia pelagia]|uniref:Lipoprotein-anchoring transpeptidase ErfK/SrfK n=1 Tax=Palleronia pelagia TaxID=387096 RepID=A0A1H8ACV4_9RHOB|nr:L,D-transpeptidase [Palleronia pelagia]SEM68692.1 Lipoprotein-anchoring transpeptidase ErfK/SrfK [Palleronia pelagia]
MISRRFLMASAGAAALQACARTPAPEVSRTATPAVTLPAPVPAAYGAITDEPFPIPAIQPGVVDPRLFRQVVASPRPDMEEGSILVDPDAAYLWLMQEDGNALRYGVSVGAAGFGWWGEAKLQYKRKWPRWTPPDEMVERRPEFEPYSIANGGMPGGPDNPLGARAHYLFQNGEDTLYRIHGACEPAYLGKAVSSGCIRMLDHDAIDLYERVRDGVRVVVLPSLMPDPLKTIY